MIPPAAGKEIRLKEFLQAFTGIFCESKGCRLFLFSLTGYDTSLKFIVLITPATAVALAVLFSRMKKIFVSVFFTFIMYIDPLNFL